MDLNLTGQNKKNTNPSQYSLGYDKRKKFQSMAQSKLFFTSSNES
jgi:hypothetical protein